MTKGRKISIGKAHLGKVTSFLIVSDVVFLSAFGLISPIFAIFIERQVSGNPVTTVAIAATIFLLAKSLFQIPIGHLLDKLPGHKDEFWFLFIGIVVTIPVPFLYIASTEPWQIYVLQFIYGLGLAINYPAFYALFTKKIARGHVGFSWGVYDTVVGLGAAGAAALGGFLVDWVGFDTTFIILGFGVILGALVVLFARKQIIATKKVI